MNKRILMSGLMAVAVLATTIGATVAYFSDTETSTGNIFVAGAIDLKVDHTRQVYNGVDCKTCSVVLVSDATNMVVAKNGVPFGAPYPAVLLNPTHPAWTAEEDPILAAAGAQWIWEQNPVKQEDTTTNATYTFRKTFTWLGPITGSDLYMAVGSDNSVKVYLNGNLIGQNLGEFGYKKDSMLHIPAATITANIVQGNNVLEFEVTNWALSGGNPSSNPAGLVYKFSINGNCADSYFANTCKLWTETDLGQGHTFFNFDDVKPGDWGRDVISLHVYDNDAWACMSVANLVDDENVRLSLEEAAGDTTAPQPGELSQNIDVMVWSDDGDGVYEPPTETMLTNQTLNELVHVSLFDSTTGSFLKATTTAYIGLSWCAGSQSVQDGGTLVCDGSGLGNIIQTDKVTADLSLYAEQVRNNPNFTCQPAD